MPFSAYAASSEALIPISSCFQNGRGPRPRVARRPFDPFAFERARHVLEILMSGAKDLLQRFRQRGFAGGQRTAEGLMRKPGMKIGHRLIVPF